jgi:hypothetical protein
MEGEWHLGALEDSLASRIDVHCGWDTTETVGFEGKLLEERRLVCLVLLQRLMIVFP